MQSKLDPTVLYPFCQGVASHDYDIEADSWNYDGLDVFRGVRDAGYSHADVFWIYDDDVKRIGVAEHKIGSHEIFHVLWYYESPFATLLQEPGWVSTDDTIWTRIPSHVYEYCIENSITTVEAFQTLCKFGSWRVVTPECILEKGRRYPDVSRILFADHDCILYLPPTDSVVWSRLQLAYDGSPAQTAAQAPPAEEPPPQQTPPVRYPQAQPPQEEHHHRP